MCSHMGFCTRTGSYKTTPNGLVCLQDKVISITKLPDRLPPSIVNSIAFLHCHRLWYFELHFLQRKENDLQSSRAVVTSNICSCSNDFGRNRPSSWAWERYYEAVLWDFDRFTQKPTGIFAFEWPPFTCSLAEKRWRTCLKPTAPLPYMRNGEFTNGPLCCRSLCLAPRIFLRLVLDGRWRTDA